MKNFRKISPRRLKKLIKDYQKLIISKQEVICTYHDLVKFWEEEDDKHFYMWTDQLQKNKKIIKIYTIWIIILNILLIIECILYLIK